MARDTVSRAGARLAAITGAALFGLSFVRGWVDAERYIVGYGQARVLSQPNAWAGFFDPWLPLVPLIGLAGAAVIVVGSLIRRTLGPLASALGVVAIGMLAVVFATGRDNAAHNSASDWIGSPGPMAWLAVVLAGLMIAGGLLSAASRQSGRTAMLGTAILAVAWLVAACGAEATITPSNGPSASAAAVADWRTDPNEPYPFMTPIPPLTPTELDGAYSRGRTDPYTGDRAACRRCPPYPLDRGTATLTLDRGRYEVLHEEPRYRSLGHFVVEGDTLVLSNDPECGEVTGTYRWERDGAQLHLEVVDDPCAFGQRAADLTARIWTLSEISRGGPCQPPNTEAAVSGHWPAPSGC